MLPRLAAVIFRHVQDNHFRVPSGKLTICYGKSQCLMGKLTISMAIFHSYVKLPEGISHFRQTYTYIYIDISHRMYARFFMPDRSRQNVTRRYVSNTIVSNTIYIYIYTYTPTRTAQRGPTVISEIDIFRGCHRQPFGHGKCYGCPDLVGGFKHLDHFPYGSIGYIIFMFFSIIYG